MATLPATPAPSAGPHLALQAIHLRRGQTQVFENLNLDLAESRIGLIGDNGVGKTSLLRLICGLEAPQQGRILFQGQDLHAPGAARTRWVGMMFQNPDDQIIFPTVIEELALSLQPQTSSKKEAKAQAQSFLQQRGLAHWADRAVSSLSQGQRQHLCWMALLIAAPGTLLLDEPYASLDLPGQAQLADDIAACSQQVLVSTHVLEHVRYLPRVIWLDAGRVRADGDGLSVCAAYEANVAQRTAQRRSRA